MFIKELEDRKEMWERLFAGPARGPRNNYKNHAQNRPYYADPPRRYEQPNRGYSNDQNRRFEPEN